MEGELPEGAEPLLYDLTICLRPNPTLIDSKEERE